METLFAPKDGIAEWQKLYDHIPKEIGKVVEYAELDAVLGRDFKAARGPIYRVIRELEQNDHRTLVCVPGVGFRVAQPAEHEALGRLHHRKSLKSLRRSRSKFASADRSLLSPELASRMDQMQARIDELEHHVGHLKIRADRQEAAHQGVVVKVEATSAELSARITKLQETLKRHGMD